MFNSYYNRVIEFKGSEYVHRIINFNNTEGSFTYNNLVQLNVMPALCSILFVIGRYKV